MQVTFSIQPAEAVRRIAEHFDVPAEARGTKEKDTTGRKPVDPVKVRELKGILAEKDLSLKFRQDEETGNVVVEIIDNKTGDAIRQMPSEVSLRLLKVFGKIQGRLMDANG
jgi:uncharacterized FlaG/YvyC family protein